MPSVLTKDSGKGIDAECLEALQAWYGKHELKSRVDLQLEAVERLASAF